MKSAAGNSRVAAAMGAFAILGILSATTLNGPLRLATLVMLAGLALKTWIAALRHKQEEDENNRSNPEE